MIEMFREYQSFYIKAVELVSREGRASVSLIQRHLNVDFNVAALLLDQLQRTGVVSREPDGHPGYQVIERRGFY